MKFIPYGRQEVSREDIEAVVAVLKSDYLTQGPAIESFEKAVSLEAGSSHAIACSNGTAALHLACMAAGLQAGDLAATSAITFVASANCARYLGAEVRFVDIDPETLTMSSLSCRRLLEKAQSEGRPVKVLVTVDFAVPEQELAQKAARPVPVAGIEDPAGATPGDLGVILGLGIATGVVRHGGGLIGNGRAARCGEDQSNDRRLAEARLHP